MEDVEKLLNNEQIKKHIEDIKKWNEEYLKRVNKKSELKTAGSVLKPINEDVKRELKERGLYG